MKKIILFLIFFALTISIKAQYPIPQSIGSTSTMVTSRGGLTAGQTFVLPAYADTSSANSANAYTNSYASSMIWSTSDSSIYVRKKSAFGSYWFRVGSAGGGTSGAFWPLGYRQFPVIYDAFPPKIGTGAVGGADFTIGTNGLDRLVFKNAGILNSTVSTDSVLVRKADLSVGVIAKSAIVGATPTWQQVLATQVNGASTYYLPVVDKNTEIGMSGKFFGVVDVNDWYVDLNTNEFAIQGKGGGANGIVIIANDVQNDLRLYVGRSSSVKSELRLMPEYYDFQPDSGRIFIDTLFKITTQDKLVGWYSGLDPVYTKRGKLGYLDIAGGLTLSNGTLSSSTVATAVPWSGVTASTADNTIANGAFTKTMTYNSLGAASALTLSTASTEAAANNQRMLYILMQGTNTNASQTTTGITISNGTGGTGANNVALYATATAGATNRAIVVPAGGGDVGIGTVTPTSLLHVVPVQTTGIGAEFISSTTTSGTIIDITGTSTALAANNEGLNIGISGANGTNAITATGARISVTNTNATSGTNVGLELTASGAPTANNALVVTAGNVLITPLTASQAVFTDGSKNLVSNAISGSGNVAMTTSPLFATPRLNSTSTIGHVWTATDGSGNGSFQAAGGGSGWSLSGNVVTANVDFMGSTNNTSVRFRTNNTERVVFDSTGGIRVIGGRDYLAATQQVGIRLTTSDASQLSITAELVNTAAAGKTYELRSVNDGTFDIYNRTDGQSAIQYTPSTQVMLLGAGIKSNSAGLWQLGNFNGLNSALWLGTAPASTSTSNYNMYGNGSDVFLNTNTGGTIYFRVGNSTKTTMASDGITTFTGTIIPRTGTASASTAPLKFTSGTLNTTAEAGTHEYNGSHYSTKASGLRFALEGTIADHYADVNNGTTLETDIYTYTTPASTLGVDGEKIFFTYTLNLNDVTATATIKCYFAGTVIANTGALTVSATGAVIVSGWIVRTAATTARASVNISSPGASTAIYTAQTDLTGLTLSGTNPIKITAQAGGAGGGSNDITGKSGTVSWRGAAAN